LEYTLFFYIFVSIKKYGIMDSNNVNKPTGNKGVWPGSNIANTPIVTNNKEPLARESNPITNKEELNKDKKTYVRLETKNVDGVLSGIFEIDLISFREKGKESRYLSVNVTGIDKEGNQSDTIISIDNETDFNKLKSFISKLNWND